MDTAITLFLAEQAPELAKAHDELYPERIAEHIPLSLTLLYPFAPSDELEASLGRLMKLPIERLLVSHGAPVLEDAKPRMAEALARR